MCGIIGQFDLAATSPLSLAPILEGMVRMHDRGPDDGGHFQAPGVAFGHRRLAIIDPVGAKQPWIDPDTGVVLVYNGELFNFRDLRRELEARRHVFRSRSDTEVLMHAWLEWELGMLDRLRGMYALAIYDPRQERLLLLRDRAGVKPLFYARRGNQLYFASTVRALLAFPEIEPVLDLAAASHYLTSIRTTMGTQTLVRDVATLLPGHYLDLRRGRSPEVTPRCYWEPPIVPAAERTCADPAATAEEVHALVEEAVTEQMVSDVPYGGFLSGGIDSSVIASVCSRRTAGKFLTYNVGYGDAGFDEWPYVQEVAMAYGITCNRLQLNAADYPADWLELIRRKGLPLSTPNEVPIWHLARAVKRDFTVALTGEGSDEVFGGYVLPYFSAVDYDRAHHEQPDPGLPASPLDRALTQLYGRSHFFCRPDHHLLLNSWVPTGRKQELFTPEVWNGLQEDDAVFNHYDTLFARFDGCSSLDAAMHVHARINLEGLLQRVDSSTMAASIEARVPFTDHRLMELLFRLPDDLRLRWRDAAAAERGQVLNAAQAQAADLIESKVLLRQAFRNEVPESILKRPKMSFPVPFQESFAGAWRELTSATLANSALRGTLFAPAALDGLSRNPGFRHHAMALWPVVNLCLWAQQCGIRCDKP